MKQLAKSYYSTTYPSNLVLELAKHINPNGELMARFDAGSGSDNTLRNLKLPELLNAGKRMAPCDGFHVECGLDRGCAIVFDIDYADTKGLDAPPRDRICECTVEGRRICGRCWLTIVGCTKMYMHMLKWYYKFVRVLCVFSGGRGVHLFVLDNAAMQLGEIQRLRLMHACIYSVPTMLKKLLLPRNKRLDTVFHLIVTGDFSVFEHLTQKYFTNLKFEEDNYGDCPYPSWLIVAYRDVLCPYFEEKWAPLILSEPCNIHTSSKAFGLLFSSLEQGHMRKGAHDSDMCIDCTLIVLHRALLRAFEGQYIWDRSRLDVFMLVVRMFWLGPDEELLNPRHMIRLPFSVHGRTGKISIPIDTGTAETLFKNGDSCQLSTQSSAVLKPHKSVLKHFLGL